MWSVRHTLICTGIAIAFLVVHASIESIDRELKVLKQGFAEDDESKLPTIIGRVYILANIYNGLNMMFRNITNEKQNIDNALKTARIRLRQFQEYKQLSLEYMQREFSKKNDELKAAHEKVQNKEITGLSIANAILPYSTKFGFFCEKLNGLLNDKNITEMISSYRRETYRMIGPNRDYYREIENEIFGGLQELISRVFYLYQKELKSSKMVDRLFNQTNELEKVDPKTFDVFLFQYNIYRGLFVTRKLVTTIIQCEAILENVRDPFIRLNNTIDQQQSKEYFGSFQ